MKAHLQCQTGGSILQGWGRHLQKAVDAVDQRPIPGAFSQIARTHEARDQGVEMGVISLTISPSGPTANLCFLSSQPVLCGPEVSVSKRSASIRRHDSTELEVKTAPQPLWAPHLSESAGQE